MVKKTFVPLNLRFETKLLPGLTNLVPLINRSSEVDEEELKVAHELKTSLLSLIQIRQNFCLFLKMKCAENVISFSICCSEMFQQKNKMYQ